MRLVLLFEAVKKMRRIISVFVTFLIPTVTFAAFEEANVPVAVKVLYCDNNPRIVVQFDDSTKNIWFPANLGEQSNQFLALATAAKTSSQKLYYYGLGSPEDLTSYCISVSARQVRMFGIQ